MNIPDIKLCFANADCLVPENTPYNMGSDYCLNVAENYCINYNSNNFNKPWFYNWITNVDGIPRCGEALITSLTKYSDHDCSEPLPVEGCTSLPTIGLNNGNADRVINIINRAIKQFVEDGGNILAEPGEIGYSLFPTALYNDVCCKYPFLCSSFLKTACKNVTLDEIEHLKSNNIKRRFCGCNLDDSQYLKYSTIFNIEPECTPLCNLPDTIKSITVNGEPNKCQENVCLISSINFDADIEQDVNFKQVCGECQPGQCYCVVQDSDIILKDVEIKGNVNAVLNSCNSVILNKQFADFKLEDNQIDSDYLSNFSKNLDYLVTLSIVVVFLLIIFILFYFILRKSN